MLARKLPRGTRAKFFNLRQRSLEPDLQIRLLTCLPQCDETQLRRLWLGIAFTKHQLIPNRYC